MRREPAATGDLQRELAEVRFSELYLQNARDLLGYALRRNADPDEAADAVAETFLVAWRRLGEVPGGAEARLWLYGTARRVLANQTRGARRRDRLTERLRGELRRQLPAHEPGERSAIVEALAELGDGDREVLMLVGWEELTPTEAARVLEISPLAARTRLHRARRRLRARLAELSAGSSRTTEIGVEEAR
jgi:RNA polymerase sigma-70 factor (ECF subfamily)